MPRSKRINYAGAYYHAFFRGNHKKAIFRCDRDRRLFHVRLAEACAESACRCLAYCLIDNHYHLVLRSEELRLSEGMQSLNARYAEHFNLAYGLTGHLFQGRFQSKVIESDSYLLE